jgi:outer membrane protein OmpA-like peptidoglycan-associated protein
MMRRLRRVEGIAAFACALVLLAGCTTKVGTVILLPEKEGKDGAVVVRGGEQAIVLDRPYAAAELTTSGPRRYQSDDSEVQAKFGAALAAQPRRPAQFTLYFVEGTGTLVEDSKRAFESVFAEIAARPVVDVVVIGHTDRVGSDPFNDALALQRAEAVRALLLGRGVAAESVVTVGRGKREPKVPTADGVAEPLNRRVEILVR